MNIEEIDIKDIEFGKPIEEKEPNYRDGYIRGIYRARNIIDNQQKEIERLNNIITYLEQYFSKREYYEFAQLVRETKKANIEWLEGAVKDYE